MHLLPIQCVCGLRSWMLLLFALLASSVSAAELVKQWTAIPARPYLLRGADRRLLDRVEQFLVEEQWDDALAGLLRLLESDSTKLVAQDDYRYLNQQQYCQRLLMRLPKAQRAEYRGLVDVAAESWYRQAIAELDEPLLRRVVEKYSCSSWADDALFAWGELALQRGDYQTARNAWLQLMPQPASTIASRVYSDTDIPQADIQARLVLASIRAGEWQRAEQELAQLEEDHPTGAGRLAGREVRYSEYLTDLLRQARGWPVLPRPVRTSTFAGTPQRTNVLQVSDISGAWEQLWSRSLTTEGLSVFPVVVDGLVIYQDQVSVHALNLLDGKPKFSAEGSIFNSPILQKGHLGQPRYTLTAYEHQVFGVTATLLGARRNPRSTKVASRLWSINTLRDGALVYRQDVDDFQNSFAGAPLVVDGRAYLVVGSNDRTARVGIACYDISRGEQLWQHWITQANSPATGLAQEWAGNLLSYDAGMLYLCTNLGAIAAVQSHNGQIAWLRTYERHAAKLTSEGECAYYRGPNPPVVHRGRVYSMPTDGNQLLALDAATGALLWQTAVAESDACVVGATEDFLVVVDNGLQVYNCITGELIHANAAGKLMGQPVLLNQTVVWPTETKIQFVSLVDGSVGSRTLELPEPGGANLTIAENTLIAAGPTRLTLFQITP